MVPRMTLGGAVWLAALFMFAAALESPAPARRADQWSVTRSRSAHHAMIVDVVAASVGEARTIAASIVEPARTRGYQEILIYVRGPGESGQAAERRVQWTPDGGYAELIIRD